MQHQAYLLLLSFSCLLLLLGTSHAEPKGHPCNKDDDCELPNSVCLSNVCMNKFYRDGCLKSYLPNWKKTRVCNSDDPPEAEEMGFCRRSQFDYLEIRALAQDWETSWFSTWILQIVLSEILDVAVSVETGAPNLSADFYGQNQVDYGIFDQKNREIDSGAKNIDCRKVKSNDPNNYEPCAHLVLEAWSAHENVIEGDVENPSDLGALGAVQWFVPRFTAEKNTSLLSYIGLAGEDMRHQLAETFKRPTTWMEYCQEVSVSNCTTNDGVAARGPIDEAEGMSYFVEGLFIGHFRATEDNDCDRFPDTCTGHFADLPCNWNSHFKQQAYHLGIALKSSGSADSNHGYQYAELAQIWAAANATKSDVMMMWWYPEALYEQYINTAAEFTKVNLPPTTQECVDKRSHFALMCGTDEMAKLGLAGGACDTYVQSLKKKVSSTLRDATFDPGTPEAMWSPAYDVISNFNISSLQYGDIFQNRFRLGGDIWDLDNSRDAACRWVIDNLDYVESFIPDSYPRVLVEETDQGDLFLAVGVGLAGFAIILVLICLGMACMRRDTKALYVIQPHVMHTLLCGLLLMAAAAMVSSLNQSDATCVTSLWLSDVGNVLVLAPLAMRVYMINKMAGSGKRMQRIRIPTKSLFRGLGCLLCVVALFLTTWTLLDAPQETLHFELTTEKTADDETIVYYSDWCSSDSDVWAMVGLLWKAVLILPAIIVSGIISRVDDINDTRSLSITLIVRSFSLVGQASILGSIDGKNGPSSMAYISFVSSADVIATTLLFVVPKLMSNGEIIEDEIPPDLFLNTTIMIADIDGFTAWTSVREPVQVFKFLETLYDSFDSIADRYGIFKVDTTGEQYVVASGLPQARADHAVVMARCASECLTNMESITKQLEMKFGPGTGDLTLRIGLHSGAVTGGFMRGKKGTFQLFGDTVTTASLIHTCGERNRIHMSEATANLLIEGGKRRWVQRCETKIQTAERGDLQTFWLIRKGHFGMTDTTVEIQSNADTNTSAELWGLEKPEFAFSISHLDSQQRWIAWNTETLGQILKKVGARHRHLQKRSTGSSRAVCTTSDGSDEFDMPLEEVQEIIELPAFDKDATKRLRDNGDEIKLPSEVEEELKEYVSQVASMYRTNPFHNFAHASYVVMAVSRYMGRIVAASEIDVGHDEGRYLSKTQAAIHDHTYGITSDPLTQFACLFSALIHDADHPGVTNPVLMKENQRLASIYKNRSVAEQNSFDMSWDLFMDSRFDAFRGFLCGTQSQLRRFRQLVINCVMATDLGDKEMKELRNGRWNKAFLESSEPTATSLETIYSVDMSLEELEARRKKSLLAEDKRVETNRKATIVIEHLIQAADVAHTCQHWKIYRKWNERLFHECYEAYRRGRINANPADTWYKGEIVFFDFYIIPLSKKLRDCGVFGRTSDENLNYAESNRALWIKKGEAIVQEMLRKYQATESLQNDGDMVDGVVEKLKAGKDESTTSMSLSS